MSTFVIGDVHGCYRTLLRLLEMLPFDSSRDELWLVGDLVNRGPRSLEVLRWASRQLDLKVVLGNHDLHLLGCVLGVAPLRPDDTFHDVLRAPDRNLLVDWLRNRQLYHQGPRGEILVHAGLLPCWNSVQVRDWAKRLESILRGSQAPEFLHSYRQGPPSEPWAQLNEKKQLLQSLAALVALRTCTRDGVPCWKFSGPPEEAPDGCLPWFQIPARRTAGSTVLFGHWAALGLYFDTDVIGLDSGCVWGGKLSAVRLEDRTVYQVENCD